MISLGQDEIAKYPFLAEAGQYLKDKGFTLDQFASDPDLQIIRNWNNKIATHLFDSHRKNISENSYCKFFACFIYIAN